MATVISHIERQSIGTTAQVGGALELLALLMLPLTMAIDIDLGGDLKLLELLLLAACPFLVMSRGRALRAGLPTTFLVLALAWFMGQMLTDRLQHTAFDDMIKVVARIVVTITTFTSLYLLLHNRWKSILTFTIGLYLAWLVRAGIAWNTFPDHATAWKFGLGIPATTLILISVTTWWHSKRRRVVLPLVALLGSAAFNLAMDCRAFALWCLVSAALLCVRWVVDCRGGQPSLIRLGLAGVGAVVVVVGSLGMISWLATTGAFGEAVKGKTEAQSDGALGLALGARGESLASLQAIIDSPILGHGSNARDPRYVERAHEMSARLGYTLQYEGADDDTIPTHSFVTQAWVNGGVLGGVFWLFVLGIAARGILVALTSRSTIGMPLSLFLSVRLAWDCLFSPYNLYERVDVPLILVVIASAMSTNRLAQAASLALHLRAHRPAQMLIKSENS